MRGVSLCSGIGGLDLAVQALGWETVLYVEINPYCQEVLLHRMRDGRLDRAPIWSDIKTLTGEAIGRKVGPVDFLYGGFPCQPHSVAGRRGGAKDDRDLWPEVRRLIGEIRPRFVFVENVPGITFPTDGREPYEWTIAGDLARLGYGARRRVVAAHDVGAPHRRDRWWLLAYYGCSGDGRGGYDLGGTASPDQGRKEERKRFRSDFGNEGEWLVDAERSRWEAPRIRCDQHAREKSQEGGRGVPDWPPGPDDKEAWADILAVRPDLAPAVDGNLNPRFVEWMMGFPVGWSDVPGATRRQRLGGLGNAVVPAQAVLAWRVLTERAR